MNKEKRKIAGLILAIACLSCGFGGAIAGVSAVQETPVVASAETTTCTMSQIGVLGKSTASVLELYSILETEKPVVDSWQYKFLFEEGSGRGFLYNGVAHTGWVMKQPGRDIYITLGKEAVAGDYVIIDGAFYNADSDTRLVFCCKFQWDGEQWVEYVESAPDEDEPTQDDTSKYTVYTVTKVAANRDSNASLAYVYAVEGDDLPKSQGNWQTVYTMADDASVKLNGKEIAVGNIKLPGDLYIPLKVTAVAGDILTINGKIYNDENGIMMIFQNCQLQFNGEKWVEVTAVTPDPDTPDTPVDPSLTTYDLGALSFKDWTADKNHLYLKGAKTTGVANPSDGSDGWKAELSCKNGGITINGKAVEGATVKYPGEFFISFPTAPTKGDVLVVSGTFYNEAMGIAYTVSESTFVWNGETWERHIQFATYDLGTLSFKDWTADKNHLYLKGSKASGVAKPEDGSNGWQAEFSWQDGVITVNGETMKGIVVKYPGEFFLSFPRTPKVGDVLTIDGTIYNEAMEIAYTVEKSSFAWDGETWIPVLDYTDYELSSLTVSNAQTQKDSLVLAKEDGSAFGQDGAFVLMGGSGKGILLNGEALDGKQITVAGGKLTINATFKAQEGDVLTLGGTFYNTQTATRYIIEESRFCYKDGAWAVYESAYTEFGLGQLKVVEDASFKRCLYLTPVGGADLPDCNGEFICAYGEGVALNGKAVKGVKIEWFDNCLVVTLPTAAEEGDTLTIGGKFASETDGVLYYVTESEFTFDGYLWESAVEYEIKEIGKLVVSGNQTTATQLSVTASGLSSDVFDLSLASGVGLTVNGEETAIVAKNAAGILTFTFEYIPVGAVVKIGGTFYNKKAAIQYEIAQSEFVWDGEAWSIHYEVVEVGPLQLVLATTTSQDLYLAPANTGTQVPASGWSSPLHLASGAYITVNGEQIDMDNTVKVPNKGTLFIRLTSSASGVANGAVVVISGRLRCDASGIEYRVEETVFVYEDGAWKNVLDEVKADALADLNERFAALAESDYYATEWALMQTTYTNAKAAITAEYAKAKVERMFEEAMALMNAIATKAEWDGGASSIKADAKSALEAYKDASLYRENEQAMLADMIAQAKTAIDKAATWANLYALMLDAKSGMDALWTAAEWDEAEAALSAAKKTLAAYKTMQEYRAEEQAALQAILAKANADLDESIGNAAAIASVVAAAKAQMNAVKTALQVETDQIAVVAAKAELEDYKTRSDYKNAEWMQIQAILAQAYADINAAMGDEDAIASIVAYAKASMDTIVGTGQESDNEGEIPEEELPKEDEPTQPPDGGEDSQQSGCGSAVSGLVGGVALLGGAAVVLLKKKQEEE